MKDVVKNMAAENANKLTPYKVRLFGMISVFKRRSEPKFIREKNDFGLIVQRPEWYDEFEFPQLALNFNKKEISHAEIDLALKNLGDALKNQLKGAGILK